MQLGRLDSKNPFDAKREIFRNGSLKIPNPASGINVNESLSTSCKEMRLIVLSARGIFTEYELQLLVPKLRHVKINIGPLLVWQAVPMQHLGASPT